MLHPLVLPTVMVLMFFRLLRRLFLFALLIVVLLVGLAFVVIEDHPGVAAYQPPSAEDVVEARQFVQDVKAALNPDNPAQSVATSEAQLNSVIKLGSRLVPGFRGRVLVEQQVVTGHISVPVPRLNGKWINLRAAVPAFDSRLTLSDVAIGPLQIPPSLTLSLVRFAANQALGDQLGDRLLDAATAMDVQGTQLAFAMNTDHLGESGSNGIMRGLFGALGGGNPPEPEDIARYYKNLRQAMDRGVLPSEGSYLPYLQFTLAAAREGGRTEGLNKAYTSAIFALTLACGARDFTLVTGGLSEQLAQIGDHWQTDCRDLTLNGRIDSRRHFTTAAAIQAASNSGVAVSIGEFKELYDSSKSGGFDFTDIAANNSGIRMSNRLMGAPAGEWPALLTRLQSEGDVIISYEGIPQIMSAADFEQSYGNVDDPRYHVMLGKIEAKIDGLALHQ